MRRWQLPSIALSLLVLAALVPASAMAEGITLAEGTEGGNAETGTAATLLSKNLVIESGTTHIECAESELSGTLGENGPKKALIELSSSRFEKEGGKCKAGSVTAAVTAGGLSWTAEFTEAGTISIAGKSGVSISATIYVAGVPVTTCKFEATKLTGEFKFNETLGAVLPSQTLKRTSGSATYCAETATLKGEFTGEGGGGGYGLLPTPTVTLRETSSKGTALAVSAALTGSSTNFFINNKDGSGRIDCATSSFSGKVVNNQNGYAVFEVASPTFVGATDKYCKSTIKPGGLASRAVITPENTPWRANFATVGFGAFQNPAGTIGFKIELFKDTDETLLLTCRYTGAWPTSYTLDAALGLTVASSISGQPRNDAGSDKGCAPVVTVSGTFTVTTSPGKQAIVPTK